jgi:hypothetical protein
LLFAQLTSGQAQHRRDDFSLVGLESDSVQLEENGHGHEGDAFVAVVEGVSGRQSVAVGRRQFILRERNASLGAWRRCPTCNGRAETWERS